MISNEPKNILLVQLYSNGDCLYATTVARQIKNDFPNSKLTWAIADFCQNIIDNNPYIDQKLIVTEVQKNDVAAFRKLKKRFFEEKSAGKWDEVFVTMNMDDNQGLYDGTVRGMILRAYPYPITVPVQPILVLTPEEINNVQQFSVENKLDQFRNVILWEYIPQSGQTALNFDFVMQLAERITALPSTCVILSSANKFKGTEKIIDASVLSIRENAGLTHHCTLLIGCSSGITWLSTSSAGKMLPMVQLLNPDTAFINAPSVDFKRYGIPFDGLIEITNIEAGIVYACVKDILQNSFASAKIKYNQELPIQFNTTRKVVYNMLCYLQFGAIAKHYKIIISIYGRNSLFLKQFALSIITFPFKLAANVFRKKLLQQKQSPIWFLTGTLFLLPSSLLPAFPGYT